MLRTVTATRYVTPLREGGSVPALVEADDDGLYVVKLLGAGHGRKALVAELLAGLIARHLDLPIPDLVLVELDGALSKAEPDQEIQELLARSAGTNFGLDFLPGALAFAPTAKPRPDPDLAAAVVWLDAYTTNVDRTPRNPNLIVWHRRPYLIDHGSALYIHHTWAEPAAHARRPFVQIADHVMLPYAGPIPRADEGLAVENGSGNLVARNVVIDARGYGIRLGIGNPSLGGGHNIVRRNLVKRSAGDGLRVFAKDGHSLLRRNVAIRAGGDGFAIRNPTTKLAGNRALRNADLGIAAVRGVIDRGGNRASGNGDARQCVHVRCD